MMKTIFKIAILSSAAILLFITDATFRPAWLPHGIQVISDAHAVAGRQRRTRRRGVAVGYSAGKSQSAAAEQESAAAEQEAAAAEKDKEAAEAEAAAAEKEAADAKAQLAAAQAAPPAGALPLGTVVSALPAGCTKTVVGGVEYYSDGVNYYRAAFQGNDLVYVTAKP